MFAASMRVSLYVSVLSTAVAAVPGVLSGLVLGLEQFRGRKLLTLALYTLLAVPTVVIGMFVYLLLSRSGPLGHFGLLYSRSAIVVGQVLLLVPMIATFTLSACRKLDPALLLTARSLGASRRQLYRTMMTEARFGILAAVIAAFGRGMSEVGISMIVGGNIAGITRTMTTAIAMEYDKGQFGEVVSIAIVLLGLSLAINILFLWLQGSSEN